MSITKPLVIRLEKLKIPRVFAALIIFLFLFGIVGYGLSLMLPSLASDMTALLKNLSKLIENIDPSVSQYINGKSISDYLPQVTDQIFPFIRNIFANVFFVITTLFFSFYFIIEENFIEELLKRFLKERHVQRVSQILDNTEKKMGTWFRGELILMLVIGFLTYIGLNLIGVQHALSLAVIAGLFEVFPIIGPILSAVPAFIFAINQSTFLGVSVIVLYIIIQQLENNLIVPVVMKRAIGLNKVLILIVIIAGGKLGGILGLFIAIPLTLCIESVLTELNKDK